MPHLPQVLRQLDPPPPALAPADPGRSRSRRCRRGVTVLPLKSSIAEETFQTLLVMKGLEQLGYDVQPIRRSSTPRRISPSPRATPPFWPTTGTRCTPTTTRTRAATPESCFRKGVYSGNAAQGYLIDKKTADAHRISNIAQLRTRRSPRCSTPMATARRI